MPANKNALIRYKTIDNCLRNHYRRWTLEDLVDACSDALYDMEGIRKGVSVRTVQGDIQMMRSDKLGYNAPIEVYDHKYYRYADQGYSIMNMPMSQNDYDVMQEAVERGINHEGVLPGPLGLARKAPTYFVKASGYKAHLQSRGLVFSYALAVSEENASGGIIATAPTCGSCGVLPAVLYHLSRGHLFSEERILHAMATAGIIGNVAKQNASIAGADVGCQGEVGVACAMASAAACQLFGGSPAQIEYAAEMGLEHHLGMTCDPMCGLVQIPCIERNAFAATRALDSQLYAAFSDGRHRVTYDRVVRVMKQTGHDLPSLYKETATGGLAKEGL